MTRPHAYRARHDAKVAGVMAADSTWGAPTVYRDPGCPLAADPWHSCQTNSGQQLRPGQECWYGAAVKMREAGQ